MRSQAMEPPGAGPRSLSRLRKRDPWDTATAILLLVVAVVICLTFLDYGVQWDEDFSYGHGKHFLSWYASGFQDRLIVGPINNEYLYGGFFNGIAAFVADHAPFGTYENAHLLIAVTLLVSIFFAYRLGKLLAGSMAGFLCALILTLTPAHYGHGFMNWRDFPFAVLFLVALYYMIRAYDELPRPGARVVVATGIAIGLTLGIRVGGVLLLAYFLVLIGLWLVAQHRKNPAHSPRAIWADLRNTAMTFTFVGLIAWMVMLVWWPYAQLNPVMNPLRAALESTNFTKWNWTVLYRGAYIPADSLPWHYLPVSFLVTLPEYYPLALAGGLVVFLIVAVRKRQASRSANVLQPGAGGHAHEPSSVDEQSKLLFLVFAAFFPLATAMVMRPVLYDVHRHFLFVIPPLAVLSGVALAWLLSRGLPRRAKMLLASLVVLAAVVTISDMVKLHPYEYAFYNRSSGGLRGADGRYETEYWGMSYKEGAEWLIGHYRPDAAPASISVANTSNPFLTSYYLASDRPETQRFVQVGLGDNPDVVLSITRWNQHLNYPGRLLHVVERMGAPLLYVVETTPPQR